MKQLDLFIEKPYIYNKDNLIENLQNLQYMHKAGLLGGEIMPEDAKPKEIKEDSKENYLFLTLPMALNYQRNSYKLWESAAQTYLDIECQDVFSPEMVTKMSIDLLRNKLLKHKVALQPNKHIDTWFRICKGLMSVCNGDVRNLFKDCQYDILKIKHIIQKEQKTLFPYLSGDKIFNYWLFVIESYTPTRFINRNEISIAPDTHIIQSSIKLGITDSSFEELSSNRSALAELWKKELINSNITPIDIHTPLWLWSRKGFPRIISPN